MAPFKEKPDSSQYQRLLLRDDGDGCSTPFENRASSDGDHSAASHQGLDGLAPSKPSQLPRLILYFSFALALLSAVNIALLPATLARYRDYPLSDSDLAALPHGAAGVGLEHVADFMPPSPVYRYSWPDKIARVSRKMKSAVWGPGMQVYITVEDSTIMRFPIPSDGANTCLLSWRAPPELSVRSKDLTTKGDISEIEIWQLIAPSATSANTPSSIEELDYDTLSYSSLPVRGAPHTLGEAQGHISQGPLGSRITWVQQSPLDYLSSLTPSSSTDTAFDATVLAYSLWYFFSPELILSTFRAIRQHSKRLLLSEWSLVASHPSAQPHLLAALAQAALECHRPEGSISHRNVRTVLGPKRLTELAMAAGWQLESETSLQCGDELFNGQWEVGNCLSSDFQSDLETLVSDERKRTAVSALRDACAASVKVVDGGRKGIKAMDIWVANFI
ncbi:hypothetical protein V2A60_004426 [Cordyceps javanica]